MNKIDDSAAVPQILPMQPIPIPIIFPNLIVSGLYKWNLPYIIYPEPIPRPTQPIPIPVPGPGPGPDPDLSQVPDQIQSPYRVHLSGLKVPRS